MTPSRAIPQIGKYEFNKKYPYVSVGTILPMQVQIF